MVSPNSTCGAIMNNANPHLSSLTHFFPNIFAHFKKNHYLCAKLEKIRQNYMKKALITGVTGQDGSYLSEFLLDKGYEVHGIIRRSSVDYRERIAHLEGQPHFHLHYGDLSDSMGLIQVIGKVRPDEIYNLAAQSHVQVSFDSPEFTADIDATGVLRVLEAVRACGLTHTCRIYQASTSELYGL